MVSLGPNPAPAASWSGPRGAVRHHFTTEAQARTVVVAWCQDFNNPQTPTQLGRIDAADPIRETRCRPTGRSVREAFTIRGKAQFMS
jgi:hypothetical protein